VKFTIVTSTYNAGELLSGTAKSLECQSYRNFEWVVADGASTDNTIEIAKSLSNVITTLISEPDSGIYDAWNKALSRLSGDWVLFLGAGDELYDSTTLGSIARFLSSNAGESSTIAYGAVEEFDGLTRQTGKTYHLEWAGIEGPWVGVRPALPHHQGVFHRSRLFKDGFRFDARCKIAADNELVLRELIRGNGIDLKMPVSRFVLGGVSTLKSNRLRMNLEMIYINWKIGIFFARPFRQMVVLGRNFVKHLFLR
jgi:glycosyltransferase involved in cell wall biosynthesis